MPPSVRCERDPAGVATVWFDVPGKSVNAVSSAVLADLDAVVRSLETDVPKGVIFASAKPGTFIVGGDLFEIRDAEGPALDTFLAYGQGILDRIAALAAPTVAALSGDTLGGGYELALACRHRIVVDDPRIRIGLPETVIGIIPGWCGTLRLPRLVGVEPGLDLLVTGRTVGPREALGIGMVDEVVAAGDLAETTRRRALDPSVPAAIVDPVGADLRACVGACDRSRAATRARSGDHLPAALRIVDVVETSYRDGFAAGAAAERRTLIELRDGAAGRNLMRIFFLRSAAKKVATRLAGATGRDVARAVVVGDGTTAAGIASALARVGLDVQCMEADASTEPEAAADLVVEAVGESLALKREVCGRLGNIVRPDAVLASVTGSVSIAAVAAVTQHPERVIGLHVLEPVAQTPLVEVVRAEGSADWAIATGVALVARIGATPIVVADAPGFVLNRVLFPFLSEAARLVDGGAAVAEIDAAARSWGMKTGPLELLDALGLDRCLLVFEALAARLGDRFAPPPALSRAVAHGWLGRTSGRGFYEYASDAAPTPNPDLAAPVAGRCLTPGELAARLVGPMADEARCVLAEGVIDSADTLDIATVLGIGFPGFRGGLATFAGLAR